MASELPTDLGPLASAPVILLGHSPDLFDKGVVVLHDQSALIA